MGYFSQLDIEKRTAQNADSDGTDEMDLRAKAEERDDARQAAEAEAAQATLAKLNVETPPEDEPIVCHTRRRDNVGYGKGRISIQFIDVIGLSREPTCLTPALVIDRLDLLHDLEQSWATGNTKGFQ